VSWFVVDVVDFDAAVIGVTQDHVSFAAAAEIAETHDLPIEPDSAKEAGVGDVVVADVIELETAGLAVTQQHVGGIATEEAAERDECPIGSDLA